MQENETNTVGEWWEDTELLEKIKESDADMENGKDKGILWAEAKKLLLQRDKK